MMKPLLRKLAYLTAVLIIFAAVLVCVTSLSTPVINKHKSQIEQIATDLLHVPVTIQNVKISWHQYHPQINLNNVTIYNQAKQPQLHADQVNIFISAWQSVWQRQIVPDGIMISGTSVNLSQDENGQFTIQGLPELNQAQTTAETKMTEVIGWLAQQPNIILHNVDVHYVDKTNHKYFVSLYNLNISNSGTEHSIAGKAVLHQAIPTEIMLEVQATGDVLDLNKLHIRSYLYVTGASLTQWLKDFSWQQWQVKQGLASAKVWAEWRNGTWQRIQTAFQTYQLNLFSQVDNSNHFFNRLSGNMGWKREGNNQVIAGDEILIDMPGHLWPVTNFYIDLKPDQQGTLIPAIANFGYLDLADLQTFLFASSQSVPANIKQTLRDLQLKGNLQNTSIVFAENRFDWNQITFNTNFNQLSFLPKSNQPGLTNLSGKISAKGMTGRIVLNSNRVKVDYPTLFPAPLNIDQMTGDMNWDISNTNNKILTINSLQILNADAAVNLQGSLKFPQNNSPLVDVKANFAVPQANHIAHYLPTKVMYPNLIEWLKDAFITGEVKSGTAVLRGALADFPFDHNNGEFSVNADVYNITLRFAPEWPVLKHVSGKLAYRGRSMTIDLDHLETLNVTANQVHGEIPYFGDAKPQILTVQSDIQTDFANALKYVHQSPLEKNIGQMFSDVELRGPLALKLGLVVPLANPDNIKVNGAIILHDAEMNLIPWNLKLNELNGALNFTESTVTATDIQAKLWNKPFIFSLSTLQKTKTVSIIKASFINQIDIADLEKLLQLPLTQYARGTTQVNGEVDLSTQTPIELRLKSDLVGVAIDLPGNLKKPANVAKDYSLQLIMQAQQPLKVKMNYAKELSAAAVVDRKNDKLNLLSAELRLGKGEANWPKTPGIYLSGDFDVLDWDQVKAYLSQTGNAKVSEFSIRGIKVHANKLILLGQTLSDVDLDITPKANIWNISISSEEVEGDIAVPLPLTRQSVVKAEFDKVDLLLAPGKQPNAFTLDVKTLPALDLSIDDLNLNNMLLGELQLKTGPSVTGVNIQTLKINSKLLALQGTGSWTKATGTKIQGTGHSAHVSELLSSFGFDVHNFIASQGKFSFDLSWNKAPYDFALADLNGSAKLDLGPGRIVDIGKQNDAKMGLGQLLSIFSLQTIPRRLSLDFSDVFSKGYTFDTLRGNFTFQNGNAYTSDFLFNGPVAKVGINGRIGLADKDFNFTLIVTPYVTSSIPVAATATLLTGNPLIGLGAFAVNTMLGPQVSKATTYYYAVTGPWNDPVWKSVDVKKR